MSTVEHIVRWGTGEWYSVLLACGHRWKLRRAQVKRAQLYEGKKVECAQCETERERGDG